MSASPVSPLPKQESSTAEGSKAQLAFLKGAFGLDTLELAVLFGVSRPVALSWLKRGVPQDFAAKLKTATDIAKTLHDRLQSERIPSIVRAPASAWKGQSMLELIAADQQQELLAQVLESFDWSSTA